MIYSPPVAISTSTLTTSPRLPCSHPACPSPSGGHTWRLRAASSSSSREQQRLVTLRTLEPTRWLPQQRRLALSALPPPWTPRRRRQRRRQRREGRGRTRQRRPTRAMRRCQTGATALCLLLQACGAAGANMVACSSLIGPSCQLGWLRWHVHPNTSLAHSLCVLPAVPSLRRTDFRGWLAAKKAQWRRSREARKRKRVGGNLDWNTWRRPCAECRCLRQACTSFHMGHLAHLYDLPVFHLSPTRCLLLPCPPARPRQAPTGGRCGSAPSRTWGPCSSSRRRPPLRRTGRLSASRPLPSRVSKTVQCGQDILEMLVAALQMPARLRDCSPLHTHMPRHHQHNAAVLTTVPQVFSRRGR